MRRGFFAGALAVATALALTTSATGTAVADTPPVAGDDSFTLEVGDDVAGGSYSIPFEKVFQKAADGDTDVVLYAPVGWNVNGGAGVTGIDPNVDPNEGDEATPCGGDVADYVLTQAQIDRARRRTRGADR